MDSKDLKILEELKKDSRRSTVQIARKLGIPRVTVHERIKKLKKSGVIKQFTILPDYKKLGKGTTAFILVSYSPHIGVRQRDVAKKLCSLDAVHEVHVITGEWDILLKARGESLEDIGSLVIDKLREIDGIEKTSTLASFGSFKEIT